MLQATMPPARRLLLPTLVALSLSGCATKEFVQEQVELVNQRLAGIENTLGYADKRINTNTARLQTTEERIGKAEQGAVALDKKITATQSDLEGANRNLAGVLMGLNAANLRIDANVDRVQVAEKRVAQVEQDASAINKRLDETQADLAGANQNLAGLLVGLNTANNRIDANTAALASSQQRLGTVEAAVQPAPQATDKEAVASAPVAAPAPMPSVSAQAAAPASSPASPPVLGVEVQDRLTRVNALIDEVHRRINVNTSSLQTANLRIGALEAGLDAAGKRTQESDAALKATQEKIDTAQVQLDLADKRINANTHAMETMGTHIDAAKTELKTAAERLDATDAQLAQVKAQLTRNDEEHVVLSRTAQEALDRANATGKLAEGRLISETVLSESIGFGLEESGLNESARLALLAFADKLKAENQGFYIEVQGHTDSTGTDAANMHLSRLRAEAVRDFLHEKAGLPLHRLSVAAYGESRPVADNATREGRIQNRRVVLVVLK